ncbi:TauD/TfdA family dioxygenase [Streptomyces sp. NPDC051243]|uniref:TauD/TfdA family dioxygenase n=1 Tax=Streptomyces sp. NPDC051243 TaxID=3365646 RepID=UPI00378A01F9
MALGTYHATHNRTVMRRAQEPFADAFAHHRIDLAAPGVEAAIAAQSRDVGLVLFDGLTSRKTVLAFAARIMSLIPHRDSDSDGLTTIRDTRRHAHRAGFAGFGNGGLDPHTERSGTPEPPRLMLLVCGQAAVTRGESLLTDGQAIHTDLFLGGREAGLALAQRSSELETVTPRRCSPSTAASGFPFDCGSMDAHAGAR